MRKKSSIRKLSKKVGFSLTSVQRILKNDLKCYPYKKITEPALTDAHKTKRKKFANWIRTNFKKKKQSKSFFQMKKCLTLMVFKIRRMTEYGQ